MEKNRMFFGGFDLIAIFAMERHSPACFKDVRVFLVNRTRQNIFKAHSYPRFNAKVQFYQNRPYEILFGAVYENYEDSRNLQI